ncbi:Protein of unknown function [Frankineae bacterium MT45]|nr:Protein of unknown function [Frankineae bacterium MT45]
MSDDKLDDDADDEVAQVSAEIERTRAELADTVNQLGDKFDVKAQVSRRLEHLSDSAADVARAASPYRRPLLIGGATIVIVLLLRRRRVAKRGERS